LAIYTLYIDDDRYRVPTLLCVEIADDARALAYIAALFTQSEHYRAIEIWEGDRKVAHHPRPGLQPNLGVGL
jgi:hypothetical protein